MRLNHYGRAFPILVVLALVFAFSGCTVTDLGSEAVYSISLSQTGEYAFPSVIQGYGPQSAYSVTVTNTGNRETGELTVALLGANGNSFILSTESLASIAIDNSSRTFTVRPVTGLSVGTYTATVIVSGGNGIEAQLVVSFTVEPTDPTNPIDPIDPINPADPIDPTDPTNPIDPVDPIDPIDPVDPGKPEPVYSISLSEAGTYTFPSTTQGYVQQSALTVTVTNTGSQTINTLVVALSGYDMDSFSLSTTWLDSIGADETATFSVVPKNDLVMGTYTATVTVSDNNTISAGFGVSFTVTDPGVSLQTVSQNRIEYYWVDQHGSLLTTSGGATSVNAGATLTITAQSTGYTVKQWHLNGVDTGQSGNTYNFSSTTAGQHTIGLFVEKDGKLYNTNIVITVVIITRMVIVDMYDSYGDGWNASGALRIVVNGIQITNTACVVYGSFNSYSFYANSGDVVQFYWTVGAGSAYQYENSFIVYYADTPPNPTFTSSNNSYWNGANALLYRLSGTSGSSSTSTLNGVTNGTLLGSFTVL